MLDSVPSTPLIWRYLAIFRRMSSACIYLNFVSVIGFQKITQTFNLYSTLVQIKICRGVHFFWEGICANICDQMRLFLKVIQGRLISYGDTVPSQKVHFFNNPNIRWEWNMYVLREIQFFHNDCFLRCNISPFNLNYKPTFYNMQFMRYTIVANPAIFSLSDVMKTLFCSPPCLLPDIVSERILVRFTCQKLFLLENLK